MEKLFLITQTIFSVLFMLSVLFQNKSSAMSLTFGGSDSNDTFYGSKQGIDKFLAYSSYLFATLFVLNALAYVVFTTTTVTPAPAL